MSLDQACQPEHALYAWDVLAAKLNHQTPPTPPIFEDLAFPLFVTWNIKSHSNSTHYRLRGCIGNFNAMPLAKGLADYAIIAATRDERFSPITLKELPRLQCGISLLTDFEPCQDAFDWELGIHGIWIHFSPPISGLPSSSTAKRSREYTATFLPDVAPSAGWDQLQTLEHAIKKSGYSGKIDNALLASIKVQRYQSSKITIDYDEWQAQRATISFQDSS